MSVHDNLYGVPFHSIHGAVTESQHVFIEAGLAKVAGQKDSIDLLEVGMGTGLNALLTCDWARTNQQLVRYTGLEPRPLPGALLDALDYGAWTSHPDPREFRSLHTARETTVIHAYFHCRVVCKTLQAFAPDTAYDLVYFDAFAPNAQPEMWTIDILRHLRDMLRAQAVLVTYCAKGQFKRDLRALGFAVESLSGPPGKREMVRATYTGQR